VAARCGPRPGQGSTANGCFTYDPGVAEMAALAEWSAGEIAAAWAEWSAGEIAAAWAEWYAGQIAAPTRYGSEESGP
jgi:hypothetical protein